MTEDTPGIGHNLPPDPITLLIERMGQDYADLFARQQSLVDAFARVPERIDDSETSGRVGDFVKQVRAAMKIAEEAKATESRPHDDAKKAVLAFFRRIIDPLASVKTALEDRQTDYLRRRANAEREAREAAERARREQEQALAAATHQPAPEPEPTKTPSAADLSRTRGDYGSVTSLRERWTFEIDDIKAIPLASLRPFLSREAIEQAIRGYIKAHEDTKPLKGVRIFKTTKAATR